MPGLFGYPQRLAVTRRCCFPDNLPCVKPFPVLSSHRSLVWLASRATRWRQWRGWNTRCPTCRVCTLHVCSSWNRAESRRKSRGKQNSLFLTVAISGRGENLNRKWSFLFAPETQDCCHNNLKGLTPATLPEEILLLHVPCDKRRGDVKPWQLQSQMATIS